jgi:CheY-like chemotaxis protein
MPDTQLSDNLLIAEDDSLLIPLLKATFRNGGLRVLTAGTGTQALEVARAERPDLASNGDAGVPRGDAGTARPDRSRLLGAPMTEKMYAEFDHAVCGPLTVILGEIELVLGDAGIPAEERGRSVESPIGAIRQIEQMLVEWRGAAGGPPR